MKFRKNTLEAAIVELLARYPENQEFTIMFHELTHDGQGWSVNDSWRAKNYATKEEVIEYARGRWETFKVNYNSKARVKDITDIGYDDRRLMLEVNYLPFMDLEPREEVKVKTETENPLHTAGGSFTGRCDLCDSGEQANRCCYKP